MLFIGIDPGQSGGFVCLEENGFVGGCTKSPDTERDIFDWLEGFTDKDNSIAMIEAVHSMPKQGVSSSFKFGQNYGFLRGCLIGLEVPFDQVTPQRWMKAMGCMSGGDKNKTKAKAQQLFPGVKVTHAIADALLIAEYCRRLRLGLLAA